MSLASQCDVSSKAIVALQCVRRRGVWCSRSGVWWRYLSPLYHPDVPAAVKFGENSKCGCDVVESGKIFKFGCDAVELVNFSNVDISVKVTLEFGSCKYRRFCVKWIGNYELQGGIWKSSLTLLFGHPVVALSWVTRSCSLIPCKRYSCCMARMELLQEQF